MPRFLSSNVCTARNALSAASDGAFAPICPVSLTAIPLLVKKALPFVFVAAGPVNYRNMKTG